MFLGYILYIRTLEHPFKWFHHFSPNTSLFAWGKTDMRCSHCHYPPVIGENTGPPVWLFPVGSAKREVGLLGPWLVLTCHRIVLNVVSYNLVELVNGHTMSFSWHALSHLLNSLTSHGWGWISFSEGGAATTHMPFVTTARTVLQQKHLIRLPYQNSTLHQAVSHGSMVDSKERSASGSKGFFPHDHPTFTCSKPRLLLSSAALWRLTASE